MMREIKFKAWHVRERKMYFRGYQKLNYVLLCRDDGGSNEGKGLPVKRAPYDECELLEGTGIADIKGLEIFEGDIVRITKGNKKYEGVLKGVPDMFKSRGLHPLHDLLLKFGLNDNDPDLVFEILGNHYESKAI